MTYEDLFTPYFRHFLAAAVILLMTASALGGVAIGWIAGRMKKVEPGKKFDILEPSRLAFWFVFAVAVAVAWSLMGLN